MPHVRSTEALKRRARERFARVDQVDPPLRVVVPPGLEDYWKEVCEFSKPVSDIKPFYWAVGSSENAQFSSDTPGVPPPLREKSHEQILFVSEQKTHTHTHENILFVRNPTNRFCS